jgi:hypothetical protein
VSLVSFVSIMTYGFSILPLCSAKFKTTSQMHAPAARSETNRFSIIYIVGQKLGRMKDES